MLLPMERERAMERARGAILRDSGDTSVMHSASSPPGHRGNSSPGIVLCTSGRGSSSCFIFRGSLEVFGISVDIAVCQPNSVARPASNAWIQTGRRIRSITSTAHTSGIHGLPMLCGSGFAAYVARCWNGREPQKEHSALPYMA